MLDREGSQNLSPLRKNNNPGTRFHPLEFNAKVELLMLEWLMHWRASRIGVSCCSVSSLKLLAAKQ